MSSLPPDRKSQSSIDSLDQFRGIAILLVVLLHSVTATLPIPRPDTWNPLSNLVYAGSTGVTLFFILSGILVTRPFIDDLRNKRAPDLLNYSAQRALRILPVYWLAATAAVIYTGAYTQLIPALFFQLENVNLGILSTVWWSLVVEVKFYIVLPLLFLLLSLRHGAKLLAAIAACWAAAFFLIATDPHYGALVTNRSLITKMPAFLVGIAIAWWYENRKATTTNSALLSLLGVACVVALSVWLKPMAMERAGYRTTHPTEIIVEALLWGAAVVCFLAQERRATGSPLSRALAAPLRFLAKTSYSLYLIHVPTIVYCLVFLKELSGIQKLAVVLLLSIVLSAISYALVEAPFLRLKRHVGNVLKPRLRHQADS